VAARLLVFVASIVVPLLKLIAMGWLLISGGSTIARPCSAKSRLFRCGIRRQVVHAGCVLPSRCSYRWCRFAPLATFSGSRPRSASARCVLTMLAAQSFDERLLWDTHSDTEPRIAARRPAVRDLAERGCRSAAARGCRSFDLRRS